MNFQKEEMPAGDEQIVEYHHSGKGEKRDDGDDDTQNKMKRKGTKSSRRSDSNGELEEETVMAKKIKTNEDEVTDATNVIEGPLN